MKKSHFFVYLGVSINSLVFIGFFQFLWIMFGAFQLFTAGEIETPRQLAPEIGRALAPLVLWGLFGFVGLLITFVTVVCSEYREKWLFWVILIFCVPYLFMFPLGSVICIAFIAFLFVKRREFFSQRTHDSGLPPN